MSCDDVSSVSSLREKYLTIYIQERHNPRFSVAVAIDVLTTVGQVKQRVLKKCLTKDGNLCDLVMLLQDGEKNFFHVNVLHDDDRIYDLICLYDNVRSFYLNISKGIKIRVYMNEVVAGMTYKTLVVSPFSTSLELIKILLHDRSDSSEDFYLVRKMNNSEAEIPLSAFAKIVEFYDGESTLHLRRWLI